MEIARVEPHPCQPCPHCRQRGTDRIACTAVTATAPISAARSPHIPSQPRIQPVHKRARSNNPHAFVLAQIAKLTIARDEMARPARNRRSQDQVVCRRRGPPCTSANSITNSAPSRTKFNWPHQVQRTCDCLRGKALSVKYGFASVRFEFFGGLTLPGRQAERCLPSPRVKEIRTAGPASACRIRPRSPTPGRLCPRRPESLRRRLKLRPASILGSHFGDRLSYGFLDLLPRV